MNRVFSTLRAIALIVPIVIAQLRAENDEDFRVWNDVMITEHDSGEWKTYTRVQSRYIDDASRIGLWFVQQKVYRNLSPFLKLGGGVTWMEAKSGDGSWNTLTRVEVEANPKWILGERNLLTLRNRLELRMWENRDYQVQYVSRYRLLFARKARWFGGMRRIEISNELFFDHADGRINENRFRPLNLFYSLGRDATANAYMQLRSKENGIRREWEHAYVLGLGVRFEI